MCDRALAGDRLGERNAMPLRECGERRLRARVADAAPGDDERLPRRFQELGGLCNTIVVRPRARDRVDRRLKESGRVVAGDFLHVLRQRDEGRPAFRGVEHDGDRLWQRSNDLLGMGDAIPIAADRLEGVVHREARIAEMLDLLQHRIGAATDERVAGEKQDRQAVGMGDAGRGHHVERAGPDRCRGDHDLPAAPGLGEADCGQRHGLLVLPAPRWQHVLNRLEGLSEAGDVAVAEDREHPWKEPDPLAIDDGELIAQIADHGLGHRAANG